MRRANKRTKEKARVRAIFIISKEKTWCLEDF